MFTFMAGITGHAISLGGETGFFCARANDAAATTTVNIEARNKFIEAILQFPFRIIHKHLMSLRILHTNDFHGMLTPEIADKIGEIKRKRDALYYDCGDCVRSGNLAIPTKPEQAWTLLQRAGCDGSVLGNRESHPLAAGLRTKTEGASHPILVANLFDKNGNRPYRAFQIFERDGKRIGVLGVMVPMVTAKMATAPLSSYLWTDPIEAAKNTVAEMPESDLVIALTHIGFKNDMRLAEAVPQIQVILGGHSHTLLEEPVGHCGCWIAQTGSHGRFLGDYEWNWKVGTLSGSLIPLQ